MGMIKKIKVYCIGYKNGKYRLLASNGTTAYLDADKLIEGANFDRLIIPNLDINIFGEIKRKFDVNIPDKYIEAYRSKLKEKQTKEDKDNEEEVFIF